MAEPRGGGRYINGDDEWSGPRLQRRIVRSELQLEQLDENYQNLMESLSATRSDLNATRELLNATIVKLSEMRVTMNYLQMAVFGFIGLALLTLLGAMFRGVIPTTP